MGGASTLQSGGGGVPGLHAGVCMHGWPPCGPGSATSPLASKHVADMSAKLPGLGPWWWPDAAPSAHGRSARPGRSPGHHSLCGARVRTTLVRPTQCKSPHASCSHRRRIMPTSQPQVQDPGYARMSTPRHATDGPNRFARTEQERLNNMATTTPTPVVIHTSWRQRLRTPTDRRSRLARNPTYAQHT